MNAPSRARPRPFSQLPSVRCQRRADTLGPSTSRYPAFGFPSPSGALWALYRLGDRTSADTLQLRMGLRMAQGRFVSYLRVSTQRQGERGLGIEAQRRAVLDFLDGGRWKLVAEYVEVESGKRNDRPQLAAALAACRVHRATLVIARLDRLSRDAGFLITLRDAGVDFVCADMPGANRFCIGVLAMAAEQEREAISARTKAALAAAKARGVKLGTPENRTLDGLARGRQAGIATRRARAAQRATDLAPTIDALRAAGARTLRDLANGLNQQGVPAPRGGAWTAGQVRRLTLHPEAR
jgi:DNA invertase Pin-like site-specific DNA recombinase